MEKPDKKLIILAAVAGTLLVGVIVLACIFFLAPTPASTLPESQIGTSLEESSAPVSSEEISSEEEPSSEPEESSSMPAFESQPEVSSKPPVVSTTPASSKPPVVSTTPASSKPPVSSAPASSAPVSSAPVSSAAPPADAVKITQNTGTLEVSIPPATTKKFYLDTDYDDAILISVEDENVKISQTDKEFSLTPNANAMSFSRVVVECQSATGSFICEIYLTVEAKDSGGAWLADAYYWESEIVAMVNRIRGMNGQPDVTISSTLTTGASTRASELPASYNLATNGNHPRPNGSNFNTVYGSEANSYIYLENIARVSGGSTTGTGAQDTIEEIFYGWRNSSSHYNAMIDNRMNTIGVGFWVGSDGKIYAAMHLSSRWD